MVKLLNENHVQPSACAMDDPVPGNAEQGVIGCSSSHPHEAERRVQRALLSMSQVHFTSLQVHCLEDGVCLTGIVRVAENGIRPQLERVAGTAAGVSHVLNRLVVQKDSGLKTRPSRNGAADR